MAVENLLSAWRARAAQFFFLIVFFSFPIFSVPCGKAATCSSPAEVVASYGYMKGVLPEGIAKSLVYPGAMLSTIEGIVADNAPMEWPAWDSILNNKFNTVEKEDVAPPVSLGFVAGCALCLIGGAFSMFGPSVFSLLGMLTVLFYIFTAEDEAHVSTMPMFTLAVCCSFGWLTFDMFTKNVSQQKKSTGILKKQL